MSLFEKLKQAFAANAEPWVESFGFHINGRSPGILRTDHTCSPNARGDFCTWWTDTGNYECKKCGEKSTDITDSYRILKNVEGEHAATRAAEALAKEWSIPFQRYEKRKVDDLPEAMDADLLKRAQARLLNADDAQVCRQFASRKWKVSAEDLVELGIGSLPSKKDRQEVLVLPTFDEQTGQLSPRYKKQVPVIRTPQEKARGAGKRDRIWAGGSKAVQPPRLWPQVEPGDLIEEFVVLEGESDLITARCRLRWQDAGVYPVAIFGKNTIPRPDAFPSCMAGKKVTILLDIDAFQGPLACIQGSDEQKVRVEQSTRGHVRQLCQYFRNRNCTVVLATVAGPKLDPVANPSGDLTDWVEAGGRELRQLRVWSYEDVYSEMESVQELNSVAEALSAPVGQRVSVIGRVHSIGDEVVSYPLETEISCRVYDGEMDKMCNKCGVPERVGVNRTQLVPWNRFPVEFAQLMCHKSQDIAVARFVCQKPSGCSALSVTHKKATFARRWELADVDDSAEGETIGVISRGKAPPIVGRVKVTGQVYTVEAAPRFMAESVEEIDANTVDIDPVRDEMLNTFPHNLDNPDEIEAAITDMALDVAANVTDISNRTDIHIGTLLTMASTLFYRNEADRPTRGWLDVTIMGLSREGKSKTVERLFQALEMGHYSQASAHSSTVPGLTSSSADLKRIRPGKWPRNHGRAICMDEMQCFFGDSHGRRFSIVNALQSARSDGYIDSAKCTGDSRMRAAVRAIFIANFPDEKAQFYCQDLRMLFPTQESIARMDFPMIVDEKVPHEKVEHQHRYRIDLLRTAVQRAWAQNDDQVRITREAFEEAAAACERWASEYEDEIALFSGAEKAESVLRIAIAAANLLFSFSADDASLMTVEVRRGHVQWACRWLERMWAKAQYDRFSAQVRRANTVQKPLLVQRLLTANLPDAPTVEPVLNCLLDALDMRSYISQLPGDGWHEQQAFYNHLKAHNVIRVRQKSNGSLVTEPTRGGRQLIMNLIELSIQNEDTYESCQKQWSLWQPGTPTSAPDLSTQEDLDILLQNDGRY